MSAPGFRPGRAPVSYAQAQIGVRVPVSTASSTAAVELAVSITLAAMQVVRA